MIKIKLEKKLADIVAEKIDLEHPNNPQFGDYSTSIALKLSKKLKKNPVAIAEEIVKKFPKDNSIEKLEVIKPGFINIWLSQKILSSAAKDIANEKIDYIPFHLGPIKKIIVEFAHPNTHKLFHIGHLRNISTGESVVRILETAGNKVVRANYQGDVGLHIAKCLYRIENGKLRIEKLKTLKEKVDLLGKAYAEGQKAYDEDETAKAKIIEINQQIYNRDPKIMPLWEETRKWSLDYFNEIYKRVASHFDRFYFESELPERGIEIANIALKSGILEKSQGAIVFVGKKYGLDTRVFINKLGYPTYEGKELALAEKQTKEFGEIDKIIHVVTPEQTSFFKVTFKVEELLDPKRYKNKQHHLIYEWVRLKTGKMSSREGNIIEAGWLLDETKNKIKMKYKCSDEIAEALSIAATKYSFLKNSTQSAIAFDIEESISLEGNSGPYLLYTYVRTQSVLKKTNNNATIEQSNNVTMNEEELSLVRTLYKFTEIVELAAKNYAPNYIANYLYDLAQKFNLFYQKHPILKAEKAERNLRIILTRATGNILAQGLYLLGIKTVDKM